MIQLEHLGQRCGNYQGGHCGEDGSGSVGAVAEVGVAVAHLRVAAVGAAVGGIVVTRGATSCDIAAGCGRGYNRLKTVNARNII